MQGNITYYILTGAAMLLSRGVGSMLQRRFKEFSQLPISVSGAEVARRMLADSGIHDVEIKATGGALTDHYHPTHKTVNLSTVVHDERNVAAAAVAAHECGHAIQHANSYAMLGLRSKMVPVQKIGSKFASMVLMVGMMLAATGTPIVFLIGIGLFALTTLFTLVTLPVEFDASRRALAWLGSSGLMPAEYQPKAKNALKWAAMTYVMAALASLGQLLYFVWRYRRLMATRR